MPDRTPIDSRTHVGPADRFDLMAAHQFEVLIKLGLRDEHSMLDVGCGSLRGGRLFIPYLRPGNYHGVEPEEAVVRGAIEDELGQDLIRLRRASFAFNADFDFNSFDREHFDVILAQSILSHTSRAQMTKMFENVGAVMHDDSLFVATVVPGEEDYTGSDWVYPGCITFTRDTVSAEASRAGLEVLWPDFGHPTQQWIVCHRPGRAVSIEAPGDSAALQLLQSRLDRIDRNPLFKIARRVRSLVVKD